MQQGRVVVADALSRKSCGDKVEPEELIEQMLQQFAIVRINEVMTGGPPVMAALVIQPLWNDRIRMAQENDLELQDTIDGARHREASGYYLTEDGILKTGRRIVIPNDAELRRYILDEAYQARYIVHPDNNKMYQDLKNKFWWCGMKRDIAEYVA